MVCFIVCIIAGIWQFYNFIQYIHPEYGLPYFMITSQENTICRVLNMLCLNWSPVIGGMLLLFGIVGLFLQRKETDAKFESFKYFMMGFSLVVSVGLIL